MIRGLVLAGGKSSRFGSDKATAVYEGVRFLERAVSLLKELGLKPVVVTRKNANYPFIQCTLIQDKMPDLGPLGGIYTAMSIFRNTAFLVLTCDMPALTLPVLSELLAKHEARYPVTAYSTDDRGLQPFPGVYEPSLLGVVREQMKDGDLSMRGLFRKAPAARILRWQGDPDVFNNVNLLPAGVDF